VSSILKDGSNIENSSHKRLKELSVIIVNYNGKTYLLRTLESIFKNLSGLDYEVVVVDNASTDGSVESVKQAYPSVRMIALPHNTGFSRGNNEGVRQATGRYILILNNDTYLPKGTVEKLLSAKKKFPDCAMVAPLVFNPDNSLQFSWGKDLNLCSEIFMKLFAEKWYRLLFKLKQGRLSRNVDWVSGACFLIDRDLYQRVQGFDENFFMYKEDADLGKRLRQLGYRICLNSEARVIHYLKQSASQYSERMLKETKKSQLYYYHKHNSRFVFRVLKNYLFFRFYVKRFYYRLKRDHRKRRIWEEVQHIVREFDGENYP
jgi:GT2 family glycosyltransferase